MLYSAHPQIVLWVAHILVSISRSRIEQAYNINNIRARFPFTITYLLDGRFNHRHVIMFKVKWGYYVLSHLGPRSLSGVCSSGTLWGLKPRHYYANLCLFSTPGLSALINYTSDTTKYIALVSHSLDAPSHHGRSDENIRLPSHYFLQILPFLLRIGVIYFGSFKDVRIWYTNYHSNCEIQLSVFLLLLLLTLLLNNQPTS